MAAIKTTKPTAATEAVKQITYLAAALKAPRITEAATRLADQARDANWTHEDYLAAVLAREVSARNSSGARLRIRAAGFGAVKTLEDFRLRCPTRSTPTDRRTRIRRVPHRSPQRRPPRTTRHRQNPPGHRSVSRRRPTRTPRPVRHRDRLGHPPHRRPPSRQTPQRARQTAPLRTDHRRRGRLPPVRARRREPVLPARLIPLRTRLPDPHQQPAVLRLGRRLRRPSRRRSHDRPHRPPRRRPHPQRRQLPTPRTRHRQLPQHPHHHRPNRALDCQQPLLSTAETDQLSSAVDMNFAFDFDPSQERRSGTLGCLRLECPRRRRARLVPSRIAPAINWGRSVAQRSTAQTAWRDEL